MSDYKSPQIGKNYQNMGKPRKDFINLTGGGNKSMLNFMKSDYDYDEVNQMIFKMRDKSQELIKH